MSAIPRDYSLSKADVAAVQEGKAYLDSRKRCSTILTVAAIIVTIATSLIPVIAGYHHWSMWVGFSLAMVLNCAGIYVQSNMQGKERSLLGLQFIARLRYHTTPADFKILGAGLLPATDDRLGMDRSLHRELTMAHPQNNADLAAVMAHVDGGKSAQVSAAKRHVGMPTYVESQAGAIGSQLAKRREELLMKKRFKEYAAPLTVDPDWLKEEWQRFKMEELSALKQLTRYYGKDDTAFSDYEKEIAEYETQEHWVYLDYLLERGNQLKEQLDKAKKVRGTLNKTIGELNKKSTKQQRTQARALKLEFREIKPHTVDGFTAKVNALHGEIFKIEPPPSTARKIWHAMTASTPLEKFKTTPATALVHQQMKQADACATRLYYIQKLFVWIVALPAMIAIHYLVENHWVVFGCDLGMLVISQVAFYFIGKTFKARMEQLKELKMEEHLLLHPPQPRQLKAMPQVERANRLGVDIPVKTLARLALHPESHEGALNSIADELGITIPAETLKRIVDYEAYQAILAETHSLKSITDELGIDISVMALKHILDFAEDPGTLREPKPAPVKQLPPIPPEHFEGFFYRPPQPLQHNVDQLPRLYP